MIFKKLVFNKLSERNPITPFLYWLWVSYNTAAHKTAFSRNLSTLLKEGYLHSEFVIFIFHRLTLHQFRFKRKYLKLIEQIVDTKKTLNQWFGTKSLEPFSRNKFYISIFIYIIVPIRFLSAISTHIVNSYFN